MFRIMEESNRRGRQEKWTDDVEEWCRKVIPFSTWRLRVALCTRAAGKENPNTNRNPNPNSHDHCLLSKWKCRTCAHTHLCN